MWVHMFRLLGANHHNINKSKEINTINKAAKKKEFKKEKENIIYEQIKDTVIKHKFRK